MTLFAFTVCLGGENGQAGRIKQAINSRSLIRNLCFFNGKFGITIDTANYIQSSLKVTQFFPPFRMLFLYDLNTFFCYVELIFF